MYRIIGADQKEYGPITADQLRQWISEGRINAATKIQVEGGGVWKTVAEFPEFVPVLTSSQVPPAPAIVMPAAPAGPKNNQMAVWAMVTGIISLICCQILCPLSIVLGIIALSQIKENPQQKGSGFAITGIVLGILSLVLIVVCIILFFSFPQYMTSFQNALGQ